ncbi:MAG: hypothetical protein ACKO24_14415 [Leptolyngbyaceae cyanobacterium]
MKSFIKNIDLMILTQLQEFRQAIDHWLGKARDAVFELMDAVLVSPSIPSFVSLSQSPVFRRKWPSVYAALQDSCPLPWQSPQDKLSPGRVAQAFPVILAAIGTPAQAPKPRGKSPGRVQGQQPSYLVVTLDKHRIGPQRLPLHSTAPLALTPNISGRSQVVAKFTCYCINTVTPLQISQQSLK